MTGGAKTSTSQWKLRKGHDGIRNYDAYRVDFSARILDTVCFSKILFISLFNFNQLDATSKVMYRHEIIYTGNKAYLINNYLFRDNPVPLYNGTSLMRSPMGLAKSDLNGEVTVLQGVKLQCGIQFGTAKG